jgi:deoxyxylulose-5-phosphate synthase
MRAGESASTSAINPEGWAAVVEPVLAAGRDALVITFSSGLSTTYQSAVIAAQELQEKYTDRKVLVVEDTPTGSGIRESIAWCLRDRTECEVDGLDLGWSFATHGNTQSLYQQYGVDNSAICRAIKEVWQYEK